MQFDAKKPSYLSDSYWARLSQADQALHLLVNPMPEAAYTVDWPLNMLEKALASAREGVEGLGGSFELNPDFQRGHVWTDSQRTAYAEAFIRKAVTGRILFNCPGWSKAYLEGDIPQQTFQCVDGLQRLSVAPHEMKSAGIDQVLRALRAGGSITELQTSFYSGGYSYTHVLTTKRGAQYRVSTATATSCAWTYEPLRLVLTGDAKYMLYATPKEDECDNRLEPHAWVHRITMARDKAGFSEVRRRWEVLPERDASVTVLAQWPDPQGWTARRSRFGLRSNWRARRRAGPGCVSPRPPFQDLAITVLASVARRPPLHPTLGDERCDRSDRLSRMTLISLEQTRHWRCRLRSGCCH